MHPFLPSSNSLQKEKLMVSSAWSDLTEPGSRKKKKKPVFISSASFYYQGIKTEFAVQPVRANSVIILEIKDYHLELHPEVCWKQRLWSTRKHDPFEALVSKEADAECYQLKSPNSLHLQSPMEHMHCKKSAEILILLEKEDLDLNTEFHNKEGWNSRWLLATVAVMTSRRKREVTRIK